MDSGNHQRWLTNIQTESNVMIQMAIPRTRPIGYLLLRELRAKSKELGRQTTLASFRSRLSTYLFALCPLPFTGPKPSLQTATASTEPKPAAIAARADLTLIAPREFR